MPSMGRFDFVSIRNWEKSVFGSEAPQEISDRFLSVGKG